MHSGIELQTSKGSRLEFDILDIFPFTSESKHIVIRDMQTGDITLLQKGADAVRAVHGPAWPGSPGFGLA